MSRANSKVVRETEFCLLLVRVEARFRLWSQNSLTTVEDTIGIWDMQEFSGPLYLGIKGALPTMK